MSGFEAWAVQALASGGVVLLVGWAVARVCRGPAGRQAAVAWAVRGAVLAAAVAALPGWLPVTLPKPAPAMVVETVTSPAMVWEVEPTDWADEPYDLPAVTEAAAVVPASGPAATPGWPAERWLAVGYGGVAGLLAVRLLVGHLALVRLTRRASPAPPRVKSRFPGRVFVADRVRSPVCYGLVRPTVLLPRGLAETASADELDWVLAHEADHLQRGDHRSAWWAAVAGCVFFPLPWFWAVRRELVLAQEFLADAAAAGDRPADYAAYLVHLSAHPERLPMLAAGVRAGRSDLSRRVTMLLNDGLKPRRASRTWRLLMGTGAVAGAVALGGVNLRQAAADEPKAEERRIEVEVRFDDDKKADDKKPDGEKKPEAKRVETITRVVKSPDVAKLKAEIKEAAKAGDADKVAELVEKLEKTLRAAPKMLTLNNEAKPGATGSLRVVPGPNAGGQPQVWTLQANGLDEAIKQLQAQLDGMKDGNAEAKQALEQALKALKAQTITLRGRIEAGDEWRKVAPAADPFAQKPRLGAVLGEVPADIREQLDLGENVGIQVAEVKEDTAAAKAGLKKGDVIVSFAGKEVAADPSKFTELVRAAKAGETKVVVLRKGKKQTLTVDLPEGPKPAADADALKRMAEKQAKLAEDQAKRAEEAVRRAQDQAKRAAERATRDRASKYDGGDFRTLNVTVNDAKFEAKATNAGIEYQIKGRLEDGKAIPESIVVKEGEQTHKGKKISDIPENCQNALERLLSKVTPPKP